MSGLVLKDVRKSYGDAAVIHGVDLDIQDGEFVVFVGPSGCGKSTLLRMIAGLESITSGDVVIGGEQVNDIAPADRGIAMVFQSYALYPHKDVYGNMAFALRHAGEDKAMIDERVQKAADILGLKNLLHRKPKELSGGQRQRVAIGRAIVRDPEIFLFDEPLSNLDAALRVQMRVEILRLHQRLKTTMIYVTHDQVEAMTLADRIVVLQGGEIEQVPTCSNSTTIRTTASSRASSAAPR
jgi:ABC-type sugar transport system ATPase subunit